MTRRTFAQELEEAADKIADVSRADLLIMIRRAALRLRNSGEVTFDPEIDAAIDALAAEAEMQPHPAPWEQSGLFDDDRASSRNGQANA